jgi:uncharacterized SAM-dependent methyltransferase
MAEGNGVTFIAQATALLGNEEALCQTLPALTLPSLATDGVTAFAAFENLEQSRYMLLYAGSTDLAVTDRHIGATW